MKLTKITLISLALVVMLIIGAGVALTLSNAAPGVKANIAFDPKYYTWDTPPPNPWNAEIWLTGGHKAATEINASTILLQGLYSPSGPTYLIPQDSRLGVPFNGNDVKAAIMPLLPTHMGILIPGRFRISLTITGNLNTGEAFSGDGVVVVTVNPPPPP